MVPIQVKPATLADLNTLVEFQTAMALESENVVLNEAQLRQGINAMITDPSKGIYHLVRLDGEPVACYMITYEWSDWRNGMIWWLQSVYVLPAFRRQGVFRAMLDQLKEAVRHNPDLLGIRLYVDKSNTKAIQTYANMDMDGSHYTVFEWMK